MDSLDKSDVAEIRVYQKPPELVATVMNAVCILLQEKPDWATAKRLLADPGFLRRLVTLDRDGLPDRTFAKLRKITKNPDFTQEKVGQVNISMEYTLYAYTYISSLYAKNLRFQLLACPSAYG